MKEVFEKIIERLEERTSFLSDCTKYGNKDAEQQNKSYSTMMMYEVYDLVDDLIEIVKQEADMYNDAIIDGKYCFQTCACTEKCDKCSRLCNGDIDWYENIDNWTEQYNNDWIPCSVELPPHPAENLIFDNKPLELYLVSVKNADYPIRAFWNGKFFTDGWSKVDVIAWQPLPQPYQPKGE